MGHLRNRILHRRGGARAEVSEPPVPYLPMLPDPPASARLRALVPPLIPAIIIVVAILVVDDPVILIVITISSLVASAGLLIRSSIKLRRTRRLLDENWRRIVDQHESEAAAVAGMSDFWRGLVEETGSTKAAWAWIDEHGDPKKRRLG